MTALDYRSDLAGYYPSIWPAECGGPRRQKATRAPGLGLGPGDRLRATTRFMDDSRWPVMFVHRAPGELYLQGGTVPGQSSVSYGWVEKLNPETLAPERRSRNLPSGGHNWCGAVCVHENGDLYVVNGNYCHRLSPDLDVVAEHRLQTENAHNGHVVLSDGNLVMKDIQNDPGQRSVFTVLDPDLKVVDRFELPWNSVGRFSSDRRDGRDVLYATSPTTIHRLIYQDGRLRLDEDWRFAYSIPGQDQGFAWDSALADDCAWFMDMGENASIRTILGSRPIGTAPLAPPAPEDGPFGRATHSAPQRVFRVSLSDPADHDVLTPFGLAAGNIIAPPLYDAERKILVAFDSRNAKVGAWRYGGPGRLEPLWRQDWLNSSQLTLFPDTGELVLDDCSTLGTWDAVVVDIETGRERGRVDTGCLLSGGMWYTPGLDRDLYTSSAYGGIARVFATR